MTGNKKFLVFVIACVALLTTAIVILPRLRRVPQRSAQIVTPSGTTSVPQGSSTTQTSGTPDTTRDTQAIAKVTNPKTVRPIKPERKLLEDRDAREKDRDAEEGEDEDEVVLKHKGKEVRVERERKPGARFDEPAEAIRWYLQKRLPKGEKELPVERYFAAREKIKSMTQFSSGTNQVLPSEAESKRNNNGLAPLAAPFIWSELGPGNVGGRTRSLVIDPGNANIMYAGAVDGGIWKTTNAGTSWAPQDDFMPNIAVTCMAMDPTNSQILYAGTGEGFFNADGVRGAGIFKTINGGTTWLQLPTTATTDFFFVQDVVVSPANALHIYAATRTGVHRSLDGGATWTQVLISNAANGANGAMDLVMRTDQATDYIFAAVGTFAQSHIWRNTDAGGVGVWTDVYTEAGMGRTSLAIAPSNQGTIYAMLTQNSAGTYQDGLLAVVRSTANGDLASWSDRIRNTSADVQSTLLLSNPVNAVLTQCGFGASQFLNQGWYDNVLVVDPTDPNIVWSGGVDLFRSNDGGVNWGVASFWWFQGNGTPPANGDPQLVHADNHVIVFHPGYNGTSNQTMLIGDDGGIYKTDNAKDGNVGYPTGPTPGGTVTADSPICGSAASDPNGIFTVPDPVLWGPLNNNFRVTQFYHGLPYPNGTTYFGGTQDNGTNRGTDAAGPNAWERIFGGDGGYVGVDPNNTQNIYAETTGLSFRRSTDGGASFATFTAGIAGDVFPFISVFQMDPSNSLRMWYGGRFMWRANNVATGASWTRASTQITGGAITAIAIAPSNPDRVINGAASGQIRGTTIGTTAISTTVWAPQVFTPRGNGNGTISWMTFHPTDANIAYCTISAFNGVANANGTNSGHVYKSTDSGLTWTLSDGIGLNTIPDIPAHSIVVVPNNPNRLYVGTDLGVFVSLDAGANWFKETGFPNVVTESLAVTSVAGQTSVFAFTHGRSAYRVGITPTAAPANVAGTVTDASGSPMGGVVMRLSGAGSATTLTDSHGNYRFSNIDTGSFYTITPEFSNYHFSPASRSFSLVGNKTDAMFTAEPDATATANAIDSNEFFVRQQYLDFLGREPDRDGLAFWTGKLNSCNTDAACLRVKRIDVSAAFFQSQEFYDTGSFVYRLYRGALGRRLNFGEFSADRSQVVGGPNLEESKRVFAEAFVSRSEFTQRYEAGSSAESFVDALLETMRQETGVELNSQRATLLARYQSGASVNESHALVVRDLIDHQSFAQSVYNASFVEMEYMGYLRRGGEPAGYNFWLNVLNSGDAGNYRGMVCSFITAAEYQHRFGSVVTHSNAECR